MDTLRLVEVAGDGALVLMTGDGRRFSLAVDEQVRSAVRRSRNGTQETTGPDRPGPREVQARIRQGADAEQVAAQTGLDVDYVRRFEGPVLAERAHVADLARATAVDRGGDPTLNLERVVLDALTGEGVGVDDIGWDSRRADGTRWEVVALTRTGSGRTEATWSFDTTTRSLEPVDAEAERLTGVERRRRLSAVRDSVFDVERPASATVRGGTVELLDALARQRGRRPAPAARPAPGAGEGDAGGTAAEEATPAAHGHDVDSDVVGADGVGADSVGSYGVGGDGAVHGPADHGPADPSPADRPDDGSQGPSEVVEDGGSATQSDDTPAASPLRVLARSRQDGEPGRGQEPARREGSGDEVSIEPDLLSELDLGQAPARTAARRLPPVEVASTGTDQRRSSRRRRAAVPSWDEIVFGAKRDDS